MTKTTVNGVDGHERVCQHPTDDLMSESIGKQMEIAHADFNQLYYDFNQLY